MGEVSGRPMIHLLPLSYLARQNWDTPLAISRKQVLEPRAPFAFPFRRNPLRTGLGSARGYFPTIIRMRQVMGSQSPENGSRLCKGSFFHQSKRRRSIASQSPENGSRLCKAKWAARWARRFWASQSPENGSRLCKASGRQADPAAGPHRRNPLRTGLGSASYPQV